MNKFDELDENLAKLVELSSGSTFIVNDKWTCTIQQDGSHSEWKKDSNSPSLMTEVHVDAVSSDDVFDGIIAVQSDMSLTHKYYAELCIKKSTDTVWRQIFTVIGISFS